MGFVSEFKTFIQRGNVLDLAVGVIIGGAFGKITASLVDNIFMPPLGLVIGGVNFKELKLVLKKQVGDVPEVAIGYGAFIQSVIDFLIIAFVIFLVIKFVNSMKKKEEATPAPPPAPSAQEVLLTEIRDLLKKS
jgi:large conductance mechanosensitive channel